MRGLAKRIFAVSREVIFIGFSVQIILGMVFMFCNFSYCSQYGEKLGLIYPVILMVCKGVGRVLFVPCYCFVYLLQFAAVFISVYRLTKAICAKMRLFWRVWLGLCVATVPMVMQCILSVLPNAFLMALIVEEIVCAYKLCAGKGDEDKKNIVKLLLFWLLSSCFAKEYLLFGGVAAVLAFGIRFCVYKEKNVKILAYGAMTLAVCVMTFGIYAFSEKILGYEDEKADFYEAIFSRTAWTTVLCDWDSWSEEIIEKTDWDKRFSVSFYADNIELEFTPYLLEKLGRDGVRELYKNTAVFALKNHGTQILHEVMWDMAGYGLSPVIVGKQLDRLGYTSLSARNYDFMRRDTPVLAAYYMDYFCMWFKAALALAAIGILCGGKLPPAKFMVLFGFAAAGMVLWYTFQGAGIMDYKKSIAITSMWIVIMTSGLVLGERR